MADDTTEKRVLFVDDEALVRKMYGMACRSVLGVLCIMACTAAEAIELLERDGADLIITDLSMPGGTGLEILAYVRDMKIGIPVVVVSGSLTPRDKLKAIELGVAQILEKPVEIPAIAEVIRRHLDAAGV